jgi:hypothetical protein
LSNSDTISKEGIAGSSSKKENTIRGFSGLFNDGASRLN